jgi:uncharacterized protein (DUF433 family)
LRAWTVGQAYRRKADTGFFVPVLRRPSPEDGRLSYHNLIEAHIVRALRTVHDVALEIIREAVAIAEAEHGIQRLLIDPRLKTSGGRLFLDTYENLVELSRTQQLAMRLILQQFLQRIEYDESNLPAQLYPFERHPLNQGQRIIVLDPFVAYGRALIARVGVSTRAIAQRVDLGEPVDDVAADYGLHEAELTEALLFESAA